MTITETKAIPVITRLGVFFAPEISADIQDAGEKISSALNVAMIDTRESKYKAIMIDLETPKKVKGIRYLPPQGQNAEGIITHYVFYAMLNGQWQKLAAGEFSNIVNNPIWQTINISPVETKLIRLDAMNLNKGTRTCYDDLEVIYE